MNKNLLLRLHRWITLVFALPLAVLIVTGLILSFEPIVVTQSVQPGAVTADAVAAVLAKNDPQAKAKALFMRNYTGTVSIGGAPGSAVTHIDLATNTPVANPGLLANIFSTSRRLHETFLLDLGWLVSASTGAMLVLSALGLFMGWPRLRNTMSGWHKGTAWILLPLVVLSPLTGLAIAFGVTFAGTPSAAAPAKPLPLVEAVRIVALDHDLSAVSWIRSRGSAVMARIDVDGEMRVFAVTRDGLQATPRNWPRAIHEGNWGGTISAAINVITSIALILLFVTGLTIWARRRLRPRQVRTRTSPLEAA